VTQTPAQIDAARVAAEATADEIIAKRQAEAAAAKAAADKVAAEKLAETEAAATAAAAKLSPFASTLDALTASGRITVARRKEVEAAIQQDKTAELLLLKLADDPVGNKEKTGPQTGAGVNPVLDYINQKYAKT